LLTPDEAAAMLRVFRATIYRMVKTRKLPFFHVGRGLRFSEKDLLDYLDGHHVDAILK